LVAATVSNAASVLPELKRTAELRAWRYHPPRRMVAILFIPLRRVKPGTRSHRAAWRSIDSNRSMRGFRRRGDWILKMCSGWV